MKTITTWMTILLLATLATAWGCEQKADDAKAKESETAEETETEEPAEEAEKDEAAAKDEADEAAAGGQWVESDTYQVKFRAPDDWEIKQNEEAVSATSPDGAVTVIMVGTESQGVFESAMANVSQELELSEVKTEKSQMTVVNGLAGFQGRGSAVLKNEEGGQEIQFIGYALKLDNEKGIAMMVFAEAEMYEARKEEIEGIANTIQKTS